VAPPNGNQPNHSTLIICAFKGIVSRGEYFILKAYNKKYLLSVHALKVFKNFCCLVNGKIKLKVSASSFQF
jgi:hypothetical protein